MANTISKLMHASEEPLQNEGIRTLQIGVVFLQDTALPRRTAIAGERRMRQLEEPNSEVYLCQIEYA